MSAIGHSTLLKFLVNTSKMSEQLEKTDATIKSKVPGEQTLRGDCIKESQNENPQENNVAITECSLSPVIKVTKEESTFTKGDLKLQKVIVSEDISDETASTKRKLTITESVSPTEVKAEVYSEVSSVIINTEGDTQTSTGDQKVVYKVTKIPKLKVNQVVDNKKKEEEVVKERKDNNTKATLGLPLPQLIRQESIQQDSPKVDDEFDRIYDEIVENGPPSGNFPSPGKIEDPAKLETKFEEIIHAYDEQKAQTTNAEKIKSKIPLLKRKSEHDIFAARQTLIKNSLKKRNSVDDTKCRLPVPLTREKQNVKLEPPKTQKIVYTKNVTVIETVNTISKSITTTSHQKDSERNITKETELNSKSEVTKSKIPSNLKKIVAGEIASDSQTLGFSSQLSVEKKSEGILINTVNKNETHDAKIVVTEDAIKISNVNDNVSNNTTESLIITNNVEKVPNTQDNIKKDVTLIITVEKDTGKRNSVTETETKTSIVTKDVKNLKLINDSTQNKKPLDATNSNIDFQWTNKYSENHFAKTEVQKNNINEDSNSVSINQEVRETVLIVSPQFSNSETITIQHDQQNKISDNIPKNISKDIINSSANPLAKNSLQEIKYDKSKNDLRDENIKINENIDTDRESATKITKRVDSKIQNIDSQDLSKSKNEIKSNSISQDTINKSLSESTQKSLPSSKTNNDTLNSTSFETKPNPLAKNSLQEIKYDKSKNELCGENIKINENIDTERESAIKITERVDSKIQNIVSQDLSKSKNEIKSNSISQEDTINKSLSESTQKSLPSSKTNNDTLNSTSFETKPNPLAKNSLQEIKYDKSKNELRGENIKINENIDTESESAIKITERVDSKIQNIVSQDLSKSKNEIKSNSISQEDTINKSLSESTQKSLPSSKTNNDTLNSTSFETKPNPLAKNSLQEIKNDKSKNELRGENIKINENIDTESESAIKIIERVDSKIQNIVSQDLSKSKNEIKSNSISEEDSINKSFSESTQKSLPSSKTNNDTLNSTSFETKQDKTVLITNEQSEAKIQQQELTKDVTKNLIPQEYPDKSVNIAKIITNELNNNENKLEVIKDDKTIKDIAITNNKVNSSETNEKDFSELEEEDVIILKGKVNRIINRLDSKEFKVNKSELEDLTLEESVVSKIALFEQSKSMDAKQTTSITKDKLADEINLDKPRIVDEVLKIENGSLHSNSKFSYDTFLNYKSTIKNHIKVNKNEVQTTSQHKIITDFDEIYNTNINLNKFDKTNENKVGRSEDELFFKNEKANKNIINEYKINKEIDLDMRRAKSLAELNYDGVQGRVRQMVVRMNSIDKMALERREQNEVRKKTRHGSVSERIALFEQDANEQTVHLKKKVTPIRMESVSTTASSPKREEYTPALNEEELAKRITELAQARVTYGHYDNMTYIELSDGGRLPTLAVGTALLDSKLVKPIIKAAIDLGYRAIDTAYVYGNEQAVGEAIREKIKDGTVKREELFILAKLWSTNHRHDLVARACQQSLDLMGLDYFDLYLIHNPMSFKEGPNPVPKIANVLQYSEHDYLEAWFGIESLIKQGLVKRGGVSNFNSVQVERVLDKGKIKPVVNQVECHPYLSQARLQDFLSSRGVALSCFGCLGSSGTPRALRSALPPVIHDPLVRTMAAGLGVTPAQLLISYQVSLKRSVVVKASSAAHLWNNIRALDLHLAPAHAAGLTALNRNKRTFTFEGMGDTHKNYPFKIPF